MSEDFHAVIFLSVAAAFVAGLYWERLRARLARKGWRERRFKGRQGEVVRFRPARSPTVPDSADQLRTVMNAKFEKRRVLSKAEAQVFYAAEKAIQERRLSWRVMAQVSLGEVLSSPDAQAYGAINSKRVDVLVVTSGGSPIAAFEYQGSGHYQGTAPARDAVKREALRRAGVRYVEITPEHGAEEVSREIGRIAAAEIRRTPER